MECGDVYRMNDFTAFGDCVILNIKDGKAKVSRPYAYVSNPGMCATVLLGAETFEISVAHIEKHWTKVDSGRTV